MIAHPARRSASATSVVARVLVAGALALGLAPSKGAAEPAPTAASRAGSALARAEAALAAGHLDDAEALAREAAAADPALVRAHHVAGLAAFRAGRFDAARLAFEEERRRGSDPAAAAVTSFNLAGAEFQLGRFADAERDYLDAAKAGALAPLATLNAGIAAENAGDPARAAAHYRRAAVLAPAANQAPVAEQAEERLAALAPPPAAREPEPVDPVDPPESEDPWRLARDGGAALKAGRTDEAVRTLQRALDRARAAAMPPRDRADLDYALGHALLAAGRAPEAVAAFRAAAAAVPADAEFHYMLGVACDRVADEGCARASFRRALDAGLADKDAAHARDQLARLGRAAPPRLTFDLQLSGGYDTHYAGAREALFQKNAGRAGTEDGAPVLLFDLEPRLRLLGTAARGLVLGDRLGGLLYLSGDADPYSLLEDTLYLEGAVTPRDFVTLSATVEGYLQTAGITTFGLFQAGGHLALRVLFLEGEHFATRLRYAVTYMHALQDAPGADFGYMSGVRQEAGITQSVWPGRFRVSLGYAFIAELVGTEHQAAADVIGDARDADLRERLVALGLEGDRTYDIPYSYLAHAVVLDGEGELAAGFKLTGGVRWERRDYLHDVVIAPDPGAGYHRRRSDDRVSLELGFARELLWKIRARASLYALFSRSTIANNDPAFPFDFDDKNYVRVVATFDLLRSF